MGWEREILLLLSVGGWGGEELLGGAEGTEALAAGGSVLLGTHSFLLRANGMLSDKNSIKLRMEYLLHLHASRSLHR